MQLKFHAREGSLNANLARERTLQNLLVYLVLFVLALLPRAYELQRFVTADEAKWVYRSAQFLLALLGGDFLATSVNLTPAVTTTWLGTLGLAFYYLVNRTALDQPFEAWLASLPEFRVELEVLAATRWPMVIFTSISVVFLFILLRRLFNPTLAFLAAIFIALDPHPVALSRILGHDAPTMVFISFSVLCLLLILKPATSSVAWLPFLCSGVTAGLAFLSKAPALFLIPFAALIIVFAEIQPLRHFPRYLGTSLSRLLLWLGIAYLTFIVFWPAAWLDPLGRPAAVVQNAFLSATDEEEASEEGFWRVPDLGPFYYGVNGAFKLSPLVMVGAGLAAIFLIKQWKHQQIIIRPGEVAAPAETTAPAGPLRSLFWLLAFVLLFTLFMTASDKRSARYLLPVFPALAIIAAWGWLELVKGARQPVKLFAALSPGLTLTGLLLVAALLVLLPYSPYYFTYFNPLLGGPFTAPGLVKIGWGEGLDHVGRFLQREAPLRDSRVGTAYASTVAPFFEGNLSKPTEANLDYVVLYLKQIQSGEPSPAFIRYFEQTGSLFSVELNGIHYADVYPGPALLPLTVERPPADGAPYPIGFRPHTVYGRIGETLLVDVVWQAVEPLPTGPAVLTLTAPVEKEGQISQTSPLAQAEGLLTTLAPGLTVSQHTLTLPANLVRGPYAIWVDEYLLGKIELRNFQIPAALNRVQPVSFSQQIALVGYQFEPTTDYLRLTVAWQAQTAQRPDYTIFAQILDAETNERLAGVDNQPLKGAWPTSRWASGEVVVDEYLIAIPPGFPPGYYKVIVGLYSPATGQRLLLAEGQDHWTLPWTFIRK